MFFPDDEPGLVPQGGTRANAVLLEGRADGVFTIAPQDDPNGQKLPAIDEIKTTYRDLSKMTAPEPVHLAQARCYAYMLCRIRGLSQVVIRMTYCNLDTEDIHYFYEKISAEDLTAWTDALLREYRRWADFSAGWLQLRTETIRRTVFPYPYREGQKELAEYVYRTIVHRKKLFLEAPTGTGKTLAALFPTLKAMGEGKAVRIFYLTAKTVTSAVAGETLELLRKQGLRLKNVTLTAKEKICVLDRPDCNPDACPRAKGHFDRINKALYALLTESDNFDRAKLDAVAEEYQVCPFELSLDISMFADVIICDYNYVFDPEVYLRRFFDAGTTQLSGNVFLVDEAHNLVERGRNMYSAELRREGILQLSQEADREFPGLSAQLQLCAQAMQRLSERTAERAALPGGTVSFAERDHCTAQWTAEEIADMTEELAKLYAYMGRFLEEERRRARRRRRKLSEKRRELRKGILEFYFELDHFMDTLSVLDDCYRIYTETGDAPGSFLLKLFCMDPGRRLAAVMERGTATILFSATLLPIRYYKKLLGGKAEDYEVYAHSVFDPGKLGIFIADDVTSKYTRRGNGEYDRIAAGIAGAVSGRHGNYLVFFPSYAFLKQVGDIYETKYCDPARIDCIRQNPKMTEEERAAFLSRFETSSDEHSLLGFCVLGGIFSEGIDLRNDALIGVVIVGTGVPQVCAEREMLKEYFDAEGDSGYDYAYRFPGMNKVLQAAGRVIRTEDDVGIAALLDERFLTPAYQRLFPREWQNYTTAGAEGLGHLADRFWSEWL
jgi:DNA excision repair protein ERCC-2